MKPIRSRSFDHRIECAPRDSDGRARYTLRWQVVLRDSVTGERKPYTRRGSRYYADRAMAERFAAKHGLQMPSAS